MSEKKINKVYELDECLTGAVTGGSGAELPDHMEAEAGLGEGDIHTPFQRMVYVVREGDDLRSVAKKFNTAAIAVAIMNGLDPDAPLIPGTELMIPFA